MRVNSLHSLLFLPLSGLEYLMAESQVQLIAFIINPPATTHCPHCC